MQIFQYHITKRTILCVTLLICITWISTLVLMRTPSNDRAWSEDQMILPYALINDETAHIHNIRNFSYTTPDIYTPNYYDRTITLSDIERVDYIVEPLADIAAAHTLLSFGLQDGSQIAISVEIRKEIDEAFSPIKGLVDEYELMYVIMDERDALQLRAIYRDNPVYIYPTIASPEMAQALFVDMLTRANQLTEKPEFYNTLTNTCATNIADHINAIVPDSIGWDYRLLLPKDSDVLAYELGFINNDTPLEVLRTTYFASDKIRTHADQPDFSIRIRE